MKPAIEQIIKSCIRPAVYVYDAEIITRQLDNLDLLPSNISVVYAMKANPNLEVLKHLSNHKNVLGFELASKGEAEKTLSCYPDLSSSLYTGPGKRFDELTFAMNNGIKLITLESLTEAHRINKIGLQDVLIRINTNTEIHGSATKMSRADQPSPFGISEKDSIAAIKEILQLPNLNVKGLHMYSATGVLDANALVENARYSFNLTKTIENELRVEFPVIDLGGGFGIDYSGDVEFDIHTYSKGLQSLISEFTFDDKELILELGRYLVADSGYFATQVVDIKDSRGKKIVICAEGTNAHRRSYAFKLNYPFHVIPMNEPKVFEDQLSILDETFDLHGSQCTSADHLLWDVRADSMRVGDYIVLKKTGAYGLSMSHQEFLSHDKVKEVFVR